MITHLYVQVNVLAEVTNDPAQVQAHIFACLPNLKDF